MDRHPENRDPLEREIHHDTHIASTSDRGAGWLVLGAIVVVGGLLAYMYFGGDSPTTADTTMPPAIDAPAETGRAATPDAAPVTPVEPAPAAPEPVDPAPAPADMPPAAPAAP